MSEDAIPNDVRDLLARYVRSVGHLELLLFLFDGRERRWTIDQLSLEMRTNDTMVKQQLRDLDGPIRKQQEGPPAYQFFYEDLSLMETVRRASELYRSRRHAMINQIYSQPLDTIRSFADAFKFKKD